MPVDQTQQFRERGLRRQCLSLCPHKARAVQIACLHSGTAGGYASYNRLSCKLVEFRRQNRLPIGRTDSENLSQSRQIEPRVMRPLRRGWIFISTDWNNLFDGEGNSPRPQSFYDHTGKSKPTRFAGGREMNNTVRLGKASAQAVKSARDHAID